MSNTDGEDTLRIEKEAIAFADSIEVNSIATHTGLVKGYIAGAKELASLREQLATEQDMRSTAEFANRMIIKDLNEKLKQKEDENRELVEILNTLQPWISGIGYIHDKGEFYNMTDRIQKAKNLSA